MATDYPKYQTMQMERLERQILSHVDPRGQEIAALLLYSAKLIHHRDLPNGDSQLDNIRQHASMAGIYYLGFTRDDLDVISDMSRRFARVCEIMPYHDLLVVADLMSTFGYDMAINPHQCVLYTPHGFFTAARLN